MMAADQQYDLEEDAGHDEPEVRALVVRGPAPKAKIAHSLQDASNTDLVHVDDKGRVRSPARFRAIEYASYGLMLGATLGITAIYGYVLGPVGGVAGLLLGLRVAHLLWHVRSLKKGQQLFVVDRFNEAAAEFRRVVEGRLVPRRIRARAEQSLAACRLVQGGGDEALALFRSARSRSGRRRGLFSMLAAYGEVQALIRLNRLPEARACFDAIGPEPAGEYLAIQHYDTELYLCFAEGKHPFTRDDLYPRAQSALSIASAGPVLGLLSWAYAQIGDRDMSQHLLGEALDRHPGPRLSMGRPAVQVWLDEAKKKMAETLALRASGAPGRSVIFRRRAERPRRTASPYRSPGRLPPVGRAAARR